MRNTPILGIALASVALAAGCTKTVRTEYVAADNWNVGEFRNCILDPAGVALLSCAAPSDTDARSMRVVYKGRRARLTEKTSWECLRNERELVCEPENSPPRQH
jgi:hypothetical protein